MAENITREKWSKAHDRCMVCGDRFVPLDTHEIVGGPVRQAALLEPAVWLRLCRGCHEQLHDREKWPVVKAMALKQQQDPENYDRLAVLDLWGRAETAITQEEVDKETTRCARARV